MIPRFYYSSEIITDQVIKLPVNISHHIERVLRLDQGDRIILFNGSGGEFLAIISCISRTGIVAIVEKYFNVERESTLNIILVQTICVSAKMDWIIQKAVELGVNYIQPIFTARSIVSLSDERAEKRAHHWQQVTISACEQSGRNRLPQVMPLLSLSNWLDKQTNNVSALHDNIPHNLCFMLSPIAEKCLADFQEAATVNTLTLLVGPEGGFSPEEEIAALLIGFVPLRLGKRILRTETAALAAIAAMQAVWGDY